jgi:hypothetical protein
MPRLTANKKRAAQDASIGLTSPAAMRSSSCCSNCHMNGSTSCRLYCTRNSEFTSISPRSA